MKLTADIFGERIVYETPTDLIAACKERIVKAFADEKEAMDKIDALQNKVADARKRVNGFRKLITQFGGNPDDTKAAETATKTKTAPESKTAQS